MAAEREAIAARTDLDRLETELADTERQLAAKGTQHSRELTDRMMFPAVSRWAVDTFTPPAQAVA